MVADNALMSQFQRLGKPLTSSGCVMYVSEDKNAHLNIGQYIRDSLTYVVASELSPASALVPSPDSQLPSFYGVPYRPSASIH